MNVYFYIVDNHNKEKHLTIYEKIVRSFLDYMINELKELGYEIENLTEF